MMGQSGNNQLLVLASAVQHGQLAQPGQLAHPGSHAAAVSGHQAATDRIRELLAHTVQDHIGRERDMVAELQEVRRRLDALEQVSLAGIAATLDGIAASLGALDSKLAARLERLDERLDDQYDRVRAIEGALGGRPASQDEVVTRAVAAATGDIAARLTSLEDTVLTLAEALLRPAIRFSRAEANGKN
jgi:DNA anti-recombination protein RmuC